MTNMKPQPKKIVVVRWEGRALVIYCLNKEVMNWVAANCSEFCAYEMYITPDLSVAEMNISRLYDIDEVVKYIERMGDND